MSNNFENNLDENRRLPANDKKKTQGLFLKGKFDPVFLLLVLSLLAIGLICLFSSSYAYALENYDNAYHFISRQAVFAVFGVLIMFVVSKLNYNIYRKFAWVIYIVAIALLIIVLLMPAYYDGFNKRWFSLGGFSFQPSEVAKFAVILLFAHLISKYKDRMQTFKFGVFQLGALLMVVCALVVIEPHLSATLLIFAIGASLMFIGGMKKSFVISALVIAGVGAAVMIVSGVVGYGAARITSWLDPWSDARGAGWQITQSLMAIGSGGLFGVGLGESTQKYLWVPEPQNDFIFSIVCEELGLVGAVGIMILFALLVWRGFVIATRAKDRFSTLLAIGLTIQVGLQAALNIMVVTNTIPNTGISLPFFSYGGTSLIMLFIQMGIILSVSRQAKVTKN